MKEVVFWSGMTALAFVAGAHAALNVRISARLLALLLVHGAEVLATAISLSVMAEAEAESEGRVSALLITLGLVLGAAVVFLAGAEPADGWLHRQGGKPYLLRLGARELSLSGAAFVALGAGLAAIGYVDVLLITGLLISNYLRALQGTTHLRSLGVSASWVLTYWVLIGLCLVGFAMLGFALFNDTGSSAHAFILAAAGGAMMVSLAAFEPTVAVGRGTLGFIATFRFGLAFLLASLLMF